MVQRRPPPSDREPRLPSDGDGLDLVDNHAPNGGYLTETAPSGGPSSYHGLWPWLVIVFVLIYGAIGAACIAAAVLICLARAPSVPLKVTLVLLSLVCFGFLVWQCGDYWDWW
jgi:hypothetical protein